MAKSSKDIQLAELKDLISQLNMTIKMLNETIAKQQTENDNLKAQMEWLKQKLFGSSSERCKDSIPGQMSLFDDEDEKTLEVIEPEVIELPKKPRRKRPTLKEQFENLPTKQIIVDTLSDEDKICPVCGTQMVPIGTEIIRTEIIYKRPKLERIEYIATTYGCPECKDTEEPLFVKDNGTPALIPGSYMSESLLSHIAYQKYGLYLPLYRQEKDFRQLNAPITRTTMVVSAESIAFINSSASFSVYGYGNPSLKLSKIFLLLRFSAKSALSSIRHFLILLSIMSSTNLHLLIVQARLHFLLAFIFFQYSGFNIFDRR